MRAVIPVIVLTAVLGAGGWLWGEQKLRSPMTVPDKPVVVAIKPGQSLASVLAEAGADTSTQARQAAASGQG